MIVVAGEALVDAIRGTGGREHRRPGGGPFNTARALARLGVPAAFLGHLSEDRSGRELLDLLTADGVSVELTTVGPEPTTVAVAAVDGHGVAGFEFVIEGTSAPRLTPAMVPDDFAPEVNVLHVGTLGLVLEPMASTLTAVVERERGKRLIMLDPNIRTGIIPGDVYRTRVENVITASTIVKASEADLAWLHPNLYYSEAAAHMLAQGPRLVAVTLGAAGAFGVHRDLRVQVVAPQLDVIDTIGAGDAFGGGLLAWLHDHELIRPDLTLFEDELRSALEYACLAASLTCARAGADPPWKREMVRP